VSERKRKKNDKESKREQVGVRGEIKEQVAQEICNSN